MYETASVVSSNGYKPSERTSLLSKDNPSKFSRQWPQHLAALLASSAAMGTGCVAGWSAPAIPYLQGNLGNLDITPITDSEASWVGSIITLGALVGAIPAGKLAGLFGRKLFLLSLTFPVMIGWLVILNFYENILYVYLGRFICGMSFGAVTVAVPMYNNEIAEDNVRGVMGVYFDMMWCIGILFAYVMGAYTSFFWLTLSSCFVPVIFFVTFIFMPESPVYLLVNHKKEAAIKSLRWLRGGRASSFDVSSEIAKIQQMIDEANVRANSPSLSPKICDMKSLGVSIKDIFGSTTTKAVIIGFGLMTSQRLSGVSAVVYYTVDIFRGAGTTLKPEAATIIVGIVSVISSCLSAIFVDRLGRRFLLILSGGAMALSLAVMTIYFIFKNEGIQMDNYSWVPVVVLCFFIGMFRIGFSPLPWLITAEILPTEAKQWGMSAIVCYSWILTFIVTKLFPLVVGIFGYATVYLIFSGINVCSVLFSFLLVPETKHKSAFEIQEAIGKKLYQKKESKEQLIVVEI